MRSLFRTGSGPKNQGTTEKIFDLCVLGWGVRFAVHVMSLALMVTDSCCPLCSCLQKTTCRYERASASLRLDPPSAPRLSITAS
jgi:hypothetical protein